MRAIVIFPVRYKKKKRRASWARRRMILLGLGLPRPNAQAGPFFQLRKEPEKSERAEKEGTDRDAEDHAVVQIA
jgi:hypothetical protein